MGFEGIIGHKDVVMHLQNAMEMDKVSHAYIFNGEKGSGKKTIARMFAQALQCQGEGAKPCGSCHSCLQVKSGNHPDIIELTHDKPNSIGVDDIDRKSVV